MIKKSKLNFDKIEVWEHLEFSLENTTYADRWKWLEEANEFVREVEKQRKAGKLFIDKT